MATISGKWVFNEIISDYQKGLSQAINFNTNVKNNCTRITIQYMALMYAVNGTGNNIYYFEGAFGAGSNAYWNHDGDRYLDFGTTEQEVSEEFYTWFIANATQQGGETSDTKPVYLRKNGAWVKQNAYERQNGEWVQVSYAESDT